MTAVVQPADDTEHGTLCSGVALGLPIYGQIHPLFHASMMNAQMHFRSIGLPHQIIAATGDSLVQRARNNIVAEFMASQCSHLMFIDCDIEFNPTDVVRLIGHGRDIVCGVYARKQRKPLAVLLPKVNEDGLCEREGDLVRIAGGGTGFMLISRRCISSMMSSYPHLRYRSYDSDGISDAARPWTYSLFDSITTPAAFYSEDYAFCLRFEAIGGSTWVDTSIKLIHHGSYGYEIDPGALFNPS